MDAEGNWLIDDDVKFNEVWAEMEKVYATGRVRAIGVSNFSIKTLEQLFTTAKVVPAVNQVECVFNFVNLLATLARLM